MNETRKYIDICPVCLDNLDKNSIATMCNHSFHYDCIFKWLLTHDSCPSCRRNLIEKYNDIIANINKTDYQIYIHNMKENKFDPINLKSSEISRKIITDINNIGYYDASDDEKEDDEQRYVYLDDTIQIPELANKKIIKIYNKDTNNKDTYVEVINNSSRGFWSSFKELFYCGLKTILHP